MQANREVNRPAQGAAFGSVDESEKNVINLDAFRDREQQSSVMREELIPMYAASAAIGILPRGDIMADLTREEMKAEIAASEARGETKIVRFDGKLDLVLSKLDDVRQDNRTTRSNQWVIGLGLAVLIVSIVALLPVFFSMGSQIRDLIHTDIREQIPVSPPSAPRTSNQK